MSFPLLLFSELGRLNPLPLETLLPAAMHTVLQDSLFSAGELLSHGTVEVQG